MTRAIFTADLHGNLALYRAAADVARTWGADALILGGDLCPATYPFERNLVTHPAFLLHKLAPLVETWKDAQPGLRIFAIPGNDDFQTILPALETLEQRGLIENLHRKAARLGSYTLVGMAFVPPTPFSVKDFERRDLAQPAAETCQLSPPVLGVGKGLKGIADLRSYLDSLPSLEDEFATLDAMIDIELQAVIAVIHCPPKDTRCDVLHTGEHLGSKSVRHWIERRQPLVTLRGHIHESPQMTGVFADRIGATWSVNPGSDNQRPHLVSCPNGS